MPSVRRSLLTIAYVSFLYLPFSSAVADRGYWGCVFKPTTLSAGPLTCRQTVTCRSKSLICRHGERTLFIVDAFADHLAASDKGEYIVGLSNRGMVPSFWLQNFAGEPIDVTPASAIQFCTMSVTNIREWFDEKHPDVTFRFAGDKLSNVDVRGCAGNQVFLQCE